MSETSEEVFTDADFLGIRDCQEPTPKNPMKMRLFRVLPFPVCATRARQEWSEMVQKRDRLSTISAQA